MPLSFRIELRLFFLFLGFVMGGTLFLVWAFASEWLLSSGWPPAAGRLIQVVCGVIGCSLLMGFILSWASTLGRKSIQFTKESVMYYELRGRYIDRKAWTYRELSGWRIQESQFEGETLRTLVFYTIRHEKIKIGIPDRISHRLITKVFANESVPELDQAKLEPAPDKPIRVGPD